VETKAFWWSLKLFKTLVFMVEEPSMREVLHIVLPKIIPQNLEFQVIAHEGKSDLERSIPRKLKTWIHDSKFIILRDKDSGDCFLIKEKLKRICREAGREDTLIRIVCCELESGASHFGTKHKYSAMEHY
jgi:hypothetical protein